MLLLFKEILIRSVYLVINYNKQRWSYLFTIYTVHTYISRNNTTNSAKNKIAGDAECPFLAEKLLCIFHIELSNAPYLQSMETLENYL